MTLNKILRIIRLTSNFTSDHGGSFSCAYAIDEYLFSKHNIQIDVIASRVSTKPPLFYNIIKVRMFAGSFGFSCFTLPELLSLFKRQSDSILVVDGLWMFHGIIGSICHLLGFRVVQFMHGHLDPYYDSNIFKSCCKRIYWYLFESHNLRNRSAVFFTTKREYEKALPWISGLKLNYFIQPLGVPAYSPPLEAEQETITVEDIITKKNCILTKNSYYLSLGRINHKKGLDILVESYQIALQSRPQLRKLVICGPTEDKKLLRQLCEYIDQKFLSDLVFIIAPVYDDHLKYQLFNNAYFFLLCTRGENYGMVVPESCSMRTPILTTDKCDLYEDILTSKAGFISECNASAFASALIETHDLISTCLADMCDSAHSLYIRKYSITSAAEKFLHHLNSL